MTHEPRHPPFRAPARYFFSKVAMRVCMLSHQPCPTLCDHMTVARQAPLSMGLSRQEYWSGLPFPPAGDLPDPGTELTSPRLVSCIAGGFFTTKPPDWSGCYRVDILPVKSGNWPV